MSKTIEDSLGLAMDFEKRVSKELDVLGPLALS